MFLTFEFLMYSLAESSVFGTIKAFRAIFTKAKLLGWGTMIVWNTFQLSMDIRVKLSDWDRSLRVWNIWTPRKQI